MDKILSCSDTVKNLGVMMDPHLSWEPHIKHRFLNILIALLHAKRILLASILPRIIDDLVYFMCNSLLFMFHDDR